MLTSVGADVTGYSDTGLASFTTYAYRVQAFHADGASAALAELQRVAYVTQDGNLYRAYWTVLDRDADAEPVLQALLTEVEEIEFFALDVSGNEHSFWPLGGSYQGDPAHRLGAILVRVDLPPFGIVERLWPVPSV